MIVPAAIANSSKWGGSGYSWADLGTAAASHSSSTQLLKHEIGHALGKLAMRQDDPAAAESRLLESNTLARDRQYTLLVFCNCYYLWRIAIGRGDATAALSHRRTLRAYVSRVPDSVPEAREFRRLDQARSGGEG